MSNRIRRMVRPLKWPTNPIVDESILGYLCRSAHRNLQDSPIWLLRQIGTPISTIGALPFSDVEALNLDKLTGAENDELIRIAYGHKRDCDVHNFLGKSIHRAFLSVIRRRCCPLCIDEEDYHRALWDVAAVTVCPIHGVPLLRACAKCGRPLGWATSNLTQCICGARFRNQAAEGMPEPELQGVRAIANLLDPRFQARSSIPTLSEADLLALYYNVGWYAAGSSGRPRPIKLAFADRPVHQWLNRGYRAAEAWPHRFYNFLDELREQSKSRRGRYGLMKEFGAFAEWAQSLNGSLGEVIGSALRDYLNRHQQLRQRARLVGTSDYMTLLDAARELQCRRERLIFVLRKHGMTVVTDGAGSGAPVLLSTKVVQKLKTEISLLIRKVEMRSIWNTSRRVTDYMLASGHFLTAHGAAAELMGGRLWMRKAIEDFATQIQTERALGKPSRPIALSKVILWLLRRGYPANDFIELLLRRRIGPVARDPNVAGLSGFVLDRKYVGALNVARLSESLSIPEAASALGLRQQVTYFLCGRGLLETARQRKVRGRRIAAKEIRRFRSAFVYGKELPTRKGKPRGWAAEHLISSGVKPVSGPSVDGSRQYVFRRADVCRART